MQQRLEEERDAKTVMPVEVVAVPLLDDSEEIPAVILFLDKAMSGNDYPLCKVHDKNSVPRGRYTRGEVGGGDENMWVLCGRVVYRQRSRPKFLE